MTRMRRRDGQALAAHGAASQILVLSLFVGLSWSARAWAASQDEDTGQSDAGETSGATASGSQGAEGSSAAGEAAHGTNTTDGRDSGGQDEQAGAVGQAAGATGDEAGQAQAAPAGVTSRAGSDRDRGKEKSDGAGSRQRAAARKGGGEAHRSGRKEGPKAGGKAGAPNEVERQSAHSGAGETGFAFGSYGRVSAATDGHGASAKAMNVASHGPRLEESPYLELDFYYRLKSYKGIRFQTVVTLGFTEDLFHYTGDWSSMMALRNLYLQADDLFVRGLSVWAGSRQYRGDDIYLLDFWPLDNLNTVGGGVIFQRWGLWAGLHAGVNRLRNEYQYQVVAVPGLNNTSEDVVLLDRQRFITSLKVSKRFGGKGGRLGFKVTGYAEAHAVGSGTYNAQLDADKQEHLPSDQGWLVGAQFGMWNFGQRATHLNFFLRYAQGLAAYGEMAVPWGIAPDRRARRARELLFALSGNYEWNRLSVLAGGYLRYFLDADGQKYDWDDGWEYVVSVRPQVWIYRHFVQAFEISYQGKWPFGLEPRTNQVERPGVMKLSVMPMVVFGKGSYDRPQLRLVYTLGLLNKGARLMYNEMDPRRDRKIQHYIGLQAEWWYNSTYR